MIKKVCEHCGKEYKVTPYHKNQKYCSRNCADIAKIKNIMVKKICEYCGKKYMPSHHNYKAYIKQKYCSRECKGLASKGLASKKRIKNVCKYCGKEYNVSPCHESQKYHSRKCFDLARSKGKDIDKEILYQDYIVKGLSSVKIARLYKLTQGTIIYWLHKYNIPMRIYESNIRKKYWDKDWLYQKYIVEKLSAVKIGKMFNVGCSGVYKFLRKFNIPIRSVGEGINNYFVDANKEKLYCDKKWLEIKKICEYCGKKYMPSHHNY
ncbi:hypothetical protein ES708_25527 [subsurface metagenome]